MAKVKGDIIYFRMQDGKEKLAEIAEKQNRTISNLVETIVLDYLLKEVTRES